MPFLSSGPHHPAAGRRRNGQAYVPPDVLQAYRDLLASCNCSIIPSCLHRCAVPVDTYTLTSRCIKRPDAASNQHYDVLQLTGENWSTKRTTHWHTRTRGAHLRKGHLGTRGSHRLPEHDGLLLKHKALRQLQVGPGIVSHGQEAQHTGGHISMR